jgi:ATP-dependent Clp protease ATP-binding subunit ClpA
VNDRDRFDKFTERARKVLSLAQEEAQRFQHNYIGTEHLLLGLVREGEGVAAKVLSNLGVELNKVRSAVEFSIGRGDRIVLGEIGLTPSAKKVIELAVDEAHRLNHHYIGTEHLLLGLVREGEGIASEVLQSLGANLEKVRTETIRVLSQPGPPQKMQGPPQLKAAQMEVEGPPQLIDELKALEAILREKEAAIQRQEYELAAELRDREVKQRDLIARLESDWSRERENKERGQEAGEEKTEPVQDGDDKAQELSQEEKDFIQTLGNLSQDERERFDTFTVRARRVLRFSREEAQRFQHNYIGTEHLLLGLARENGGTAAAVLRNLGVGINKVRSSVEFIIGRGDRIVLGEIGLTPRAKKVLELAADEARRLNHDSIGTGHLLLGLVREGEGIAAGVLESLGVNLEKVRTQTIRVLNQQKDS